MPLKYHMPKLLNLHQSGKYINPYRTYELTGINHMTSSVVYKKTDANTDSDDDATQLH